MVKAGFAVGNLDATIIAEQPRLSPHQEAMHANLVDLLKTAPERINLKVTSTDRLGAIGRGQGIASLAIILLEEANA